MTNKMQFLVYLFVPISCHRGLDGTQFNLIHGSSKQQYWLTVPEAVCTVTCS